MSTIKLENIQTRTGSGTITIGASGETVSLGSGVTTSGIGKVLQVVSTATDTQFSTTSNSFTDLTPITVNITPSKTSSKILIFCNLNFGGSADNRTGVRLLRNSTNIFQGADESNRQGVTTATETAEDNSIYNVAFQYLDSPSTTSELTYHIQVSAQTAGSETVYLNRTGNDANQQYTKNCASSITVMEVGA